MLLFPPMENYAAITKAALPTFEGFYFVFGDKWGRNIHVPLLYLEVLCVLINTAALWLLLREPESPDR